LPQRISSETGPRALCAISRWLLFLEPAVRALEINIYGEVLRYYSPISEGSKEKRPYRLNKLM
jgi:hypothetical protein